MSGAEQNAVKNTSGLPARHAEPAHNLLSRVKGHIMILKEFRSWERSNFLAVWKAMLALREFTEERVHREIVVNAGGVEALIPHLRAPLDKKRGHTVGDLWKLAIERQALSLLIRIAKETEGKLIIVEAGALSYLVGLLLRKVMTFRDCAARLINQIIHGAVLMIGLLSQENEQIQDKLGKAGVISPLLVHFKSAETELQRDALETLGFLASDNAANRNQIIDHIHQNGCPALISMLQSDNEDISKVALEAVINLVKGSSISRKRGLLRAGVLEPVVCLLDSSCQHVQSQAMVVLHHFARVDCFKVPIVHQCGAVGPILKILESADAMTQAGSLNILGKLASKPSNQAEILSDGGLNPLLGLLESTNESVQTAAVSVLFEFCANRKNVSRIIQGGGVQLLHHLAFSSLQSKMLARAALEMLKGNTSGSVLKQLLHLMGSADDGLQEIIACALAYLCSPNSREFISIMSNGLEILLDMLSCTLKSSRQQMHGAQALHQLATTEMALSDIYAVRPPMPMIPPVVYLGEKYVNNTTSSDVTFLVEGIPFYAHKTALCASSDTFRAMLEGGYKEQDLSEIPIKDISWNVFELMMRHIYTGSVEVTVDEAQELFQAADQYLLESLKKRCEGVIEKGLTVENAAKVYGLAEAHQSLSLERSCVLFVLEEHEQICNLAEYPEMMEIMIPGIREYFLHVLSQR